MCSRVDLDGDEVTLTFYELPPAKPGHVSQFFPSIARPKFHVQRRLSPRAALPAAQLSLNSRQARAAGPSLQQRRVRDNGLVSAGVAARAHQVEHAQVFEPEGIARRHRRVCSFLAIIGIAQKMNTSTAENRYNGCSPQLPIVCA